MKIVAIVLAACVLAGCAAGPAIHVEQDSSVDFRLYRTYTWKQHPPISNPLLRQRLVAAIDAELAAKGWRSAPDVDADVLLVGNVSSLEDASLNYFYEDGGWDGWHWRGHGFGGMQRIEFRVLRIGTLVVDAFEAKTRRAIWRGLAQGYVPDSEAQKSRDAMAAVRRMFREFPEAARDR